MRKTQRKLLTVRSSVACSSHDRCRASGMGLVPVFERKQAVEDAPATDPVREIGRAAVSLAHGAAEGRCQIMGISLRLTVSTPRRDINLLSYPAHVAL